MLSSGRAQIQGPGASDHSLDGVAPAGLFVVDPVCLQGFDRLAGLAIPVSSVSIGQIMAEIRADHDQGLGPAPQPGQQTLDHCRRCRADHHWHDRKIAQQTLQERKLGFQRMFLGMGAVADFDAG